MSRRKKTGRDVDGILLLDKPLGLSSNAALQRVKRLFNANKAGHTGSLDPLATGLLPLCFGSATKVSGFLLDADKSYDADLQLGITTTTGDAEGEVLQVREVPRLKQADIDAVLLKFTGELQQIPPMYSALKQGGQRLYTLARQNITVERAPRAVTIFEIKKIAFDSPFITLAVRCSKGTYIRTLAEDIGEVLGCGAHLRALRRTALTPFNSSEMVTLESLEVIAAANGMDALDARLINADLALERLPFMAISADIARDLRYGKLVVLPEAPQTGLFRLYCPSDDGEEFVGLAFRREDGQIQSKRLF